MTWQPGDFWTEEKVKAAHQHYIEDGKTAAETARLIGASTRSMVIGKAHRLGWKRKRGASEGNFQRAVRAARAQRAASVARPPKAAKPKVSPKPPRDDAPLIDVALGGRLPVMNRFMPPDASPTTFLAAIMGGLCRWPIEAAAAAGHSDMECCGAPVAEDAPYCPCHVARSGNGKPLPKIKSYDPSVIHLTAKQHQRSMAA